MNELMIKDTFTSLELVDLINDYRSQEGNRNELLHKNLLQVIREEFEEEINRLEIQPISYKDSMNRDKPMYVLTLNQSRQVAVRESRFVRKSIMKYIEEMEARLNSPDYILKRANEILDQRIKKLTLDVQVKDQQIAELQPKATYYDLILQCKNLLSVTEISKDYGLSAKRLNKLLHELGVQYKQSRVWFLYQKYADKGYTQTKTQNYNRPDGAQGSTVHMYWTQKGRLFLYDLLKSYGYIPMIEQELTA